MVGRDGDLGQGITGVGQTDVDGLTLAGGLPLVQSGHTADGGMQGGDAVDDGHAGPDWRHAFFAGDHGDAGHGLADGVITNLVTVGPKLAVGGDVHHDDARAQLFQFVVAEAHFLDGAGPEILEQDV